MRRALLFFVLMAAAGVVAAPEWVRAAGQFENPSCGFRFQYPDGWNVSRLAGVDINRRSLVETPDGLALGNVGPVWDERASNAPADAVARARQAELCLFCFSQKERHDSLVWVDRFTRGAKIIGLIIYKQDRTVNGTALPGYRVDFTMLDDGSARNLRPNGWTNAEALFWVYGPLLTARRPEIIDIVTSMEFTLPQLQPQDCRPAS